MTTKPPSSSKHRGPKGHKVTADQILEAAARVFAEEGLQAASLRAIAKEAGCDPALIYYHFDSKEDMFMALLDRCIPLLTSALVALAREEDARPTPYRLREFLVLYREHMGHHAGLRAIIRGELARGAEGLQGRIAAKTRANAQALWTLLRQGIARKEIRPDIPVELTGFFFIKLYLEILDVLPAVAPLMAGIPGDQAVAQAERAWLQTFWRGIALDPTLPLPSDLFE
jgi:AcrR family transcriptional regulator